MHRWLAVLVVTSGCDYLLGLTHLGPRGPADDKASVTGTFVQRWIENDSGGLPSQTQQRPLPLGGITSTVRLDDGGIRDVTWSDAQTFTFTIETAGQGYAFELHGPYGDTSYQLAVPDPALVERYPGRIDRDPVVPGTILKLHVNNRPAGEAPMVKEEVHSTGVWSRTQITPENEVSGQADYTLDWATVDNAGGAMGLTAPHDSLWYAHYTTDVNQVVHLDTYDEIRDAMLVSGGTAPYTVVAPTPFAFSLCSAFKADIIQEVVRVTGLAGANVAGVYSAINATPQGGEFAWPASFPLAYASSFHQPTEPDTVTTTMLRYIDPYPTTEHRVQLTILAIGPAGALSATYLPRDTSNSCTSTTAVASSPVAIATSATLGGIALDAPGKPLHFDPQAIVDVDWQPSDGAVDYWTVRLQQMIGNTAIDDLEIITTDPHATFAASRLIDGKMYRIEIQAWVGFADAQTGHFAAFDPTSLSLGSFDSPAFQY